MKRLLPPVLMLLCLVLMVALHAVWPEPAIPAPYSWIGPMIVAAGLALAIAGRLTFARRQTEIYTFREPGQLVTSGVFRISRNPMYLGMLLVLVGAAIWLGSLVPFLVAAAFAVIADRWYIAYEERAMAAKFGDAYRAYCAGTRRWL